MAPNANQRCPIYRQGLPITHAPVRTSDAYAYGHKILGDAGFFTGGAATKSYLLLVEGSRPAGYPATGDSNDAVVRINGNNYAANDANFIWRGLNVSLGNRSGGTLGIMEHALGVQAKSGATTPTLRGLAITVENYGTCATEFGGLDISVRNEAAVATTEYGLRIRNTNNSLGTYVGAAILVTDAGANIGWGFGLDLYGSTIQKAALRDANQWCGFSGAGVPTDNVTGATFAAIGSIYADITAGKLYVNGGTMALPVWKLVTSA
jgi:hypothetical protein